MDHVLKENDLVLVSDEWGDISRGQQRHLGLYYRDTRYVSILQSYDGQPRFWQAALRLDKIRLLRRKLEQCVRDLPVAVEGWIDTTEAKASQGMEERLWNWA